MPRTASCSSEALAPLQYTAGTLPSQGVLHYQGPPNAGMVSCLQGIISGPDPAWSGMSCASAISRLVPGHRALAVTPAETNVPLPIGCLHTGAALAPQIGGVNAVREHTLQALPVTGQGFSDGCRPLPGQSQTESAPSDHESSIAPAAALTNQSSSAARATAGAGATAEIRPQRTQEVVAPLAATASATVPSHETQHGAATVTHQIAVDVAGDADGAPEIDGREPKRPRY